jgi:hypothetical protein
MPAVGACTGACAEFMASSGLMGKSSSEASLEPALSKAQVVFVACNGISLGGGQIRCLETARVLSARGTPSRCLTDCSAATLTPLSTLRLRAVVFIRTLPADDRLLARIRPAACTWLLDSLDMSSLFHKRSCEDRRAHQFLDGVIVNNRASWTRLVSECPRLVKSRPVHMIEHFHSVTHRVSDGTRWSLKKPRALLVQEHRVKGSVGFCTRIQHALPQGMGFDCNPLWGGPNAAKNRIRFLAEHLGLEREVVKSIATQHLGTGAMYTAVYEKYDLLVQWLPTNSSAQRLLNALATGVPVVAQACPTFTEAAAGHPDVLLAHNHSELQTMAQQLASSDAFRRRVSNAGVAVASRFSPDLIHQLYLRAFNASFLRGRGARAEGAPLGCASGS